MADLSHDADIGPGYQAYRQVASADEIIARSRARVQAQEAEQSAKPKPTEGAPSPDAPPPAKDAPGSVFDRVMGPASAATLQGAAKGGYELAKGMIESPRQAIGGATDAIREALSAAGQLDQWISRNIGLGDETSILTRIGANVPEVDPARSAAGNTVRETTRFLTGFVPAMKVAKEAGIASKAVQGVVAGAVSDAVTRDPSEENLSNLIQKYPAIQNPVSAFLASDPNDGEALARLKKGLEGAGFGAAAEGVALGVKAIRAARGAGMTPGQAMDELAAAKQKYGEVGERDYLILGDPNKPLVSTKAMTAQPEALATSQRAGKLTKAQTATAEAEPGLVSMGGDAGGKEVYVNFARIEGPDDVKALMGKVADAFSGSIDKAKRGVQSNAETQKLADELGMTVGDVLSRRNGQPFNAEEALAARKLWAASATKLLEVADKAAGPNAGQVDLYNFRKMMAIHYALQAEVIGARTETARALQAWSIPAGGGVEQARAIQMLMDGMGGPDVSIAMAKRLATLKAEGVSQEAMNAVVRKGALATTMDAVKEAYVMGLLWSPKTHIVNTTSNMIVAGQQIYERKAAELIGQATDSGGVVPGEARAMAYGAISGLKDAFRLAGRALKTGETGASLGKIDLGHDPAISGEAFGIADTSLGKAVDYIGHATRVPGRLLGAEDEFFKSIGYRMEVHAQALRQATGEGLEGKALKERIADLTNNPPEHIRISAADAALYNTFTNQPGEWAQAAMNLRNAGELNPTFVVLPFLRTPANILRYGFERSPLAPLVGQWRADIAAGGARADLAMARMSTGSAIMALFADYATSGTISGAGPRDSGQREALLRQGWQPYSIYVNGKWYSYNRESTIGTLAGVAATMAEISQGRYLEPEEMDQWNEVTAEVIAATAKSVTDKSFFQGVANVVSVIEDPQRYTRDYVSQTMASFTPFGSALSFGAQAMDPTRRETGDPWSAIRAKLPVLAESLPPKRDLWGREIAPQAVYGKAYDLLSPVPTTEVKDSPIDAEMTRLGMGVTRIPKKTTLGGVDMDLRENPQAYDELTRLAGNELQHPAWKMGAMDYLNAVVAGQHPMSQVYNILSDGKDGGKAGFIRNAIEDYRNLAKQKILDDPKFKDLRTQVEEKAADKQRQKMPVLQ